MTGTEVYGEEFEDAKEVLRSYWQNNIDESQLASRISACRDNTQTQGLRDGWWILEKSGVG